MDYNSSDETCTWHAMPDDAKEITLTTCREVKFDIGGVEGTSFTESMVQHIHMAKKKARKVHRHSKHHGGRRASRKSKASKVRKLRSLARKHKHKKKRR